MRDKLTGALIGLARATDGSEHLICDSSTEVVVKCLAALGGGSERELENLLGQVEAEKRKMVPDCFLCANPCGKTEAFDMAQLFREPEADRELKNRLLLGIQDLAVRGCRGEMADSFYYKALVVIGISGLGETRLMPLVEEMQALAENRQ